MESMDADCYVLEYMIRDRLTSARARARNAALFVDASDSQGPNAVKTRFTDPGKGLVKRVRKVVGEISHALPGGTRIAKHS
jgi:hypothetical protein